MKFLPLAALFLASLPAAQLTETPGPYPVGWSDVSFTHPLSANPVVKARIYYPAVTAGSGTAPDASSGPYPQVAFMHGFLGSPSVYDVISIHLASWGFLLGSIGTETGFSATMQDEAQDTQAMLHWMEAQSADPVSPWFGMAAGGDWSASGHSMGGGACFHLIGMEPRVRTLVPLQPWRGTSLGGSTVAIQNAKVFDGDLLLVAGQIDTTVPAATMVYPWFTDATLAGRRIYTEVQGMGHAGPTDFPPGSEPLPGSEQQRLHKRLLAGFLRAQVKGEEELYVQLLGELMDVEPVDRESGCIDPPAWTETSTFVPGTLVTGLGGTAGDFALIALAPGTGSLPTPFGVLGLDLTTLVIFQQSTLGPDGSVEVPLPVPPELSGLTFHFQALALSGTGGALSRTVAYLVP